MLLDYALLTAPTPLQAGTPATLTLAISNGTRQAVTVTSIVITLPLGGNAKDLASSGGFQSAASSGWNIGANAGVLTLTPTGSGVVTTDAIVVTIANVAVNEKPGTADISISETAAAGGGSPTTSGTSLPAAKFPQQFSLSDLVVTPTQVAFGGSVSVMWTGTQAEAATYTLDWPEAPTHPVGVTNVGPYQATGLTVFPAVFSLTVSLTVPGQDAAVTVQKQATVTETPKVGISWFGSSQPSVAGTQTFDLRWEVQMATSLRLEFTDIRGPVIDVSGLSSCTVAERDKTLVVSNASAQQIGSFTPPYPFPPELSFRLTASGATGSETMDTSVLVGPPATISTFTMLQLPHGQEGEDDFFLFWSTSNAASAVIEDFGNVPVNGQIVVAGGNEPPPYTYKITVTGYGGRSVTTATTKWDS
jgi:hypothetical protein